MYTHRNNEALSRNHFCCGKVVSVKHSECMFVCVFGGLALVIGRAKRMRRVMLSTVACVTVSYFFHIISKRHFRKTVAEPKMRILIFSTTFFFFFLKHFLF